MTWLQSVSTCYYVAAIKIALPLIYTYKLQCWADTVTMGQVEMAMDGSDDEAGQGEALDEAIPTPQELTRNMHAVQAAVEAVEEAEARGLLQPWTQTPRPGCTSASCLDCEYMTTKCL